MDAREQTRMDCQHIFAVNDSPDFLDIIRELLQSENYTVTTTNFVPHTFDQIAALDPNLLIIDLVFGDRSGVDLLACVDDGASTQQIPIIIVSTSKQLLEEFQAGPQSLAEYRILQKPFDLDVLLGMVDDLIGPD